MAQASLVDRGITVSGFINRSQVVNAAFTHSSSDFSHILAGGAEKSVLKGWQDSGETFQKWTRTGSLSNFHEAKRVGLNGFSKLDKVPEGAEYKYITTSDKGVPIALATYGNIFSVTRQAIINDDLTQLTTIPMAMGRAAARTVGNLVYLLLTSNGKFTDGKALFHADHKNLIAKDMDMVGLDEARKLMRLQEDANGDSLNITPAFVLVPAALESAARRAILSSSSVFPVGDEGTINQNPGIINVVKDMAEVIVEPRLDKANSKEWYVAAAKGMDTIEVAYLDGMDTGAAGAHTHGNGIRWPGGGGSALAFYDGGGFTYVQDSQYQVSPGTSSSRSYYQRIQTQSAGAHTHSLSGTAASSGAHAHTVGIGAHTHSVAIGSHGHTITVNAAGNAENTVKNIAFNYIVRLA
ncbi:ATP-dependent Clp protease proteolytic subunit (Endopeptidase Clp) of prophage [Escherichia coli]|nr:ATP-dependent Clp protease proteolytic subunit (Endopeptidase Clp) of prophage [Escherichia coli]SQT87890.1 ATP-dependent Clp protease proteolytic subunit (Endopeptidase Clp) of prophage [Escherichia coli]